MFAYRVTPQSTMGVTPAELLLGRQPRTRLDLLKPNTANRVEFKQQQQKKSHDSHSRVRVFTVGDKAYAKNFTKGQRWLLCEVTEVTSPVSFIVKLLDGRIIRRHQGSPENPEESLRIGGGRSAGNSCPHSRPWTRTKRWKRGTGQIYTYS